MLTRPDYLQLAADFARLQFTPDRLVDRVFRAELEERAITARNEQIVEQAVRDTLYETSDVRRI